MQLYNDFILPTVYHTQQEKSILRVKKNRKDRSKFSYFFIENVKFPKKPRQMGQFFRTEIMETPILRKDRRSDEKIAAFGGFLLFCTD